MSGDRQTGTVGTALAPLIVKVTDNGNPVVGQVLNFRVTSGNGSVYGGTEITGDKGLAQEIWTLGTRSGLQSVEVRAVDGTSGQPSVFATYSATAIAAPAAQLSVFDGNGQFAIHNTAVAISPAVVVQDRYGNVVRNQTVNFVPGPGDGSATEVAAMTDMNGIARVGSWTVGSQFGTYTLTASVPRDSVGGNPVTFTATATCDCWSAGTSLPAPLKNFAYGTIRGVVYVTGGAHANVAGTSSFTTDLLAYDPVLGSWVQRTSMPTLRYEPASAVVDGILYVAGGQNADGVLQTLEAFDPRTNSWTTLAPMLTARRFAVAFGFNGLLYVAGGIGDVNGEVVLQSVESYDPETNTWTPKASMLAPQVGFVGALVGDRFYAAGGFDRGSGSFIGTTEQYDPVNDKWVYRTPMKKPRYGGGGAAVNGSMFVIGGEDLTGVVGYVEMYDPVRDAWSDRTPMPTAREFLGSAILNGKILNIGGDDARSTVFPSVEIYRP